MRNYDPITYRFPRTTGEAFGCDATTAVALHPMRSSFIHRFRMRHRRAIRIFWKVLCWTVAIWAVAAVFFHYKAI